MTQSASRDGTWLWVALLTVTSAVTTTVLACAMPFVALAAIAATRMPGRAGVALIGLTWAINQAVGYSLLSYPHDATTAAWGIGILSAALAAVAAARWGDRTLATAAPALRLATAFGVGFVAYKAMLLGWSLVLGGVHTATSPYWTARQFALEGAVLVGLVALYHLLVAVGVPAARRVRFA